VIDDGSTGINMRRSNGNRSTASAHPLVPWSRGLLVRTHRARVQQVASKRLQDAWRKAADSEEEEEEQGDDGGAAQRARQVYSEGQGAQWHKAASSAHNRR